MKCTNERADVCAKLLVVFILNVLALAASGIFFSAALNRAQHAYNDINSGAKAATLAISPSSFCVVSPSYPFNNKSGNSNSACPAPRRVCNDTYISYYRESDLQDDICSSPLDVTDSTTVYHLMRAMMECGSLRYLTEDFIGTGYNQTGPLDSNITVGSASVEILQHYFGSKTFDFTQMNFFPSCAYDNASIDSGDFASYWLGEGHVRVVMPGTVEMVTLQPKNIWLELFPDNSTRFSCSNLPQQELLLHNMTCLAGKLLNATSAGSSFQCKNGSLDVISLLASSSGSDSIAAGLTFASCAPYHCFNDDVDAQYFTQFNDQVTLLQRQNQYPFLIYKRLHYDDLNNIYIALMGVFCATVLATCITALVCLSKLFFFWHPGVLLDCLHALAYCARMWCVGNQGAVSDSLRRNRSTPAGQWAPLQDARVGAHEGSMQLADTRMAPGGPVYDTTTQNGAAH